MPLRVVVAHSAMVLAFAPTTVAVLGWAWCVVLGLTAAQRTWLAWRHLPRDAA